MSFNMKALKSLFLTLLTALPFVHLLSGCGFNIPIGHFGGNQPRTSAIFCDVEADRRCATPAEVAIGVDITRPFEDGFWVGKSGDSPIGLDYSAEALAACGGPRAVVFKGAFPEGSPACLNPNQFPDPYVTVNDACKAWCTYQGWIDGDGNAFRCQDIAWQSNGAATPFAGACDDAGTRRANFQDPRQVRMNVPVVWTAVVGATANGNSLTKTDVDGWGNAGAVSTHQLTAGDGMVIITASETTDKRIFGLGNGSTTTSYTDIKFGLVLDVSGNLIVAEAGNLPAGVVGTYAPGDLLSVHVSGGVVTYRKSNVVLYTSTVAPTYPLRAAAALFATGATLNNARVTF
jgi:hypothetical protein